MKITKEFLRRHKVCSEGYEYVCKNNYIGLEAVDFIKKLLLKENHWEWANWLIVRCMTYEQYVSYAVFAAEQVLPIFARKYPSEYIPRKAIELAMRCTKKPTQKNKAAADRYAIAVSNAAANTTDFTFATAYAADNAADAIASAAHSAAEVAAERASSAAAAAAAAAADAADADHHPVPIVVRYRLQNKIINYGLKLLKKKREEYSMIDIKTKNKTKKKDLIKKLSHELTKDQKKTLLDLCDGLTFEELTRRYDANWS